MVEVPRVARRAVGERFGGDRRPPLGGVRPAEDDEPGAAELPRQVRVGRGDVTDPLQRPRPRVVGLPGHRQRQVLDEEGHTAQRPAGERGELGPGPFVARPDHRVDLRVEPLDALNRRVDELFRRRIAAADEVGTGGRVEVGEVVGRHLRKRRWAAAVASTGACAFSPSSTSSGARRPPGRSPGRSGAPRAGPATTATRLPSPTAGKGGSTRSAGRTGRRRSAAHSVTRCRPGGASTGAPR